MKHRVLVISTFLFLYFVGYAQNRIQVENGISFYLNQSGNVSVLKKSDNSIIESTPIFNETTYTWELKQKNITDHFDGLQTIEFNEIKELTYQELQELLENKRFSIKNETLQIDFVRLDDFTFAYTTSENSDIPRATCNAHYIEVNKRYITVFTDNGYNVMGYMYPTDKGMAITIISNKEAILPYESIQTLSKDEKEKIDNYFSDFFRHYKTFLVGNKLVLCNRNNRPIKPQLFDKIIMGDTDILTLENDTYILYSKEMKPITIGDIQVAHEFTKARKTYIEAIVDNKHGWIKKGEILNENISEFDWALHGRIDKPTNIKYSFEEYLNNDFKLVLHPQDRFSKPTYEDSIVLNSYKPLQEYQDIVFANHFPYIGQVYDDVHSAEGVFKATLMDDGFNDYKDYAKLKTENIFVQKNGKWGIDSLDIKVNKRFYELVELLPPNFDKLEELHYPMLDIVSRGRFDYLGWNRQPVIFYEGKLMGVYPMTKDAKYKKIDKKIVGRYFYRATLSNGKGAWLDVLSGKEYIDRE